MTKTGSTFRQIVTRCLAVGALLCLYGVSIVSTSALFLTASTTAADARGGGHGGGGFRGGGFRGGGFRSRGFFRGRGFGFGGYYAGPGCFYSYRFGRVICPYYDY